MIIHIYRKSGILLMAALLMIILLLKDSAAAESVSFGKVIVDRRAEYVDMGEEKVEDWEAFYVFLSRLPCLRKVDLFATKANVFRVEKLHEKFPSIEFGMTMCFENHVLRTDATAFSTLHTSHSIRHTERDLSIVRYCTNLYALDLGHNQISDLSFLRSLQELRILIIAMDQVTDISAIADLKHLEYLEIFNNSISDISCLSGLDYLMDLNIVKNIIDDLTPITEIHNLRRLWMDRYDIRMSNEEIQRNANSIREMLPQCEIDDVSSAVDGAWRSHPHYEVIHRVFTTGVYEPFEDSPYSNIPDCLKK